MDNDSEKSINSNDIDSELKYMTTYYPTKQEAESHITKKEERVYFKAGRGWYVVSPEYIDDASGNIRFYST